MFHTGQPIRNEEVTVQRIDKPDVVVLLNIDPLFDAKGRLIGVINCFQDITERQRMVERAGEEPAGAARAGGALARDLRASSRSASSRSTPKVGFLRVNEAICSIVGGTREELLGWKLFGRTHPDDRDVDGELYRKQVAGEIGFYSIDKRFIRRDGRMIWMGVRSSTVRDPTGKFLYGVRVVQDITERKEAEARQKLLIDELNHRVKNTLATVQSLAAQTARGTQSTEEFHQAFEGRLIALSHAHDQLTRQHWQSADFRDIVKGATGPHLSRPEEQLAIQGEAITVSPRMALAMALVLHEMTTNAAKYGALSAPEGRIEIGWRSSSGGPKSPLLHIEWRERNGPPVEAPAKPGFGSRFIQGSVTAELRGSVRMNFNPDGLHCTIDVPLDPAADDEQQPA